MVRLDKFLASYIGTALWLLEDGKYSPEDLADATRAAMRRDCAAFIEKAGDLLDTECRLPGDGSDNVETGGHDFWLTRNGHGAGFWDGDWPEAGDRLTEISKGFGEADLYVGDDKRIYQAGDERMVHTLEGIATPDGRRSGKDWEDMMRRATSGDRVQVTEEEYMYFLEILPPLAMSGSSFLFAEGDMTPLRFERRGETYWVQQHVK